MNLRQTVGAFILTATASIVLLAIMFGSSAGPGEDVADQGVRKLFKARRDLMVDPDIVASENKRLIAQNKAILHEIESLEKKKKDTEANNKLIQDQIHKFQKDSNTMQSTLDQLESTIMDDDNIQNIVEKIASAELELKKIRLEFEKLEDKMADAGFVDEESDPIPSEGDAAAIGDTCSKVYVGSRTGGYYLSWDGIKNAKTVIIVSSGFKSDHSFDLALLDRLKQDKSTVEAYLFDPHPNTALYLNSIPKLPAYLTYADDAMVFSSSTTATLGDLGQKANIVVEPNDHPERVVLLETISSVCRVLKLNHLHILRLELLSSMYDLVKTLKNSGNLKFDQAVINFLPPTGAVSTEILEANVKDMNEAVDLMVKELGWRIFYIDTKTTRKYTFIRACMEKEKPCSCCRSTVPFFCSMNT